MLVVAGVPPRLLTLLAVLGLAGVVVAFYLDLVQRYAIGPIPRLPPSGLDEPQWAKYIYNVDTQERHWLGGLHGVGSSTVCRRISGTCRNSTRTSYSPPSGSSWASSVAADHPAARLRGVSALSNGRLAKDTMGRIICIGVFVFFAFSCFENIG